MSKFLSGIAHCVPALSKFLRSTAAGITGSGIPATIRDAMPRSLQRIVSRDPLHSKFIAFFVPEKLTLEYKGPDAATVRAEASIKQTAATVTTPRLKPRFNRPAGPSP